MGLRFARQLRKPHGFLGRKIGGFLEERNKGLYLEMEGPLQIQGDESLLEIGFGPGFFIERLFSLYDGIKITGLDFSPLMCKQASRRNRRLIEEGQLALICDDFRLHDFGDSRFSRILFVNVIQFWEDYRACLEKILSLLDPKGFLFFHFPDKPALESNELTNNEVFQKRDVAEVLDTMRELGYRNVESIPLSFREGHYFIKGEK